jgi:hypothetical protein
MAFNHLCFTTLQFIGILLFEWPSYTRLVFCTDTITSEALRFYSPIKKVWRSNLTGNSTKIVAVGELLH